MVGAIALVLAVPVTTAAGAFFAKAADTQAGTATERGVTALRARFAR
jgi:trimethylamine:corrinoid methyltransferase-like protein